MAAYTIVLEGAAGVVTVTPKFNFAGGTVEVEVEDIYIENLISGTEASINLNPGQKLEYICSNWEGITRIEINGDKVSGDVSGWVLPPSLTTFRIDVTSVSGDVSGWVLPNSLVTFYLRLTLVSGDISGWTLPTNLVNFYLHETSVSGDISGWILPNNLANVRIYSTSLDYDSFSGALTGITDNLAVIDFDNCNLTQSQVDNILADLVASGIDDSVSPKTIDVGDNNAGPSILGWSKKLMLETRGWTVKVNAFTSNGLLELSRTGHRFLSFPEN